MWYHLYVQNPDTSGIKNKIMDEFFALQAISKNTDLCVFSNYDLNTGGEDIYFAPGTETVAKKNNAKTCENPSREKAGTLLYGNQAVVETYFS